MKIDIVSVFPEYFEALNVGLFGRAIEHGLLDVKTHDLRDWTHDVHHSVDDTPVGGGAGMVMKPEVWAECLDDLLGMKPVEIRDDEKNTVSTRTGTGDDDEATTKSPTTTIPNAGIGIINDSQSSSEIERHSSDVLDSNRHKTTAINASEGTTTFQVSNDTFNALQNGSEDEPTTSAATNQATAKPVLIFPNPSAPLFTQRDATELSHADHLLFGCGRYEGYDARIPRYYRAQGVDVREYSIGDYVLNGGEVAVSVMLEAITRLMPGFMGNPDSIVEESYTGQNALLEHYQYTKPAVWRGMGVPDVLTSGDHDKVNRFRRDEAISHTDRLRPDLIEQLDCKSLDKADRKTLMSLGWEVSGPHPRKLDA
ncbi:tRNA (guanine(37)-N(1))-methyltransferase [Bifidobacterium sp. ESL0745]|uniref:tRNA (guanine(37)-N(1))-methyltransferase n=1 Tax=Bifidobacterium sp. ESL0745 TaxID=2983226 RepID=UPI0023F9D8CC|nr:tRNA (guanine(37)-N(1))-methyltransferase [Bifidobacterium sp. ESL0745]MDF7666071.1 tRNA (guanine(37)-N(1))-methyltransferase [Bifidobacterium sp. ESL0745]